MKTKTKFPKTNFPVNTKILNLISKLPAKETVEVINSLVEYKKVKEQEDTKKLAIERKYEETSKRLDLASEILRNSISNKSIENQITINNVFLVVERMIEKGNIEAAERIIISLLNSDRKYITSEVYQTVSQILKTKGNSTQMEEDYIEVEPIIEDEEI